MTWFDKMENHEPTILDKLGGNDDSRAFNPEEKDAEKIKEIRSLFYRRDESTLSYREKEKG